MNRDEIIHMAQEADLIDFRDAIPENYIQDLFAGLTRFAELVAAAEREACEGLCGELANNTENSEQYRMAANWCRERIRARGNT